MSAPERSFIARLRERLRYVIEFLHEFGHVMHSTLSTARYATLYGPSVRGDFVETPSQMPENWAWQPAMLRHLSRHVETGEPLPDPLIDNMLLARHADAGLRYRREILEPGGTAEPGELLRNFLGREVSYEPFYRDLGLSPAAPR